MSYKAIIVGVCVSRVIPYLRQMVFAKCHHPFVLHMAYAFQTELHVILVLDFVTSGTIQVSAAPTPLPHESKHLLFSYSYVCRKEHSSPTSPSITRIVTHPLGWNTVEWSTQGDTPAGMKLP